jgi:hypothetical protein
MKPYTIKRLTRQYNGHEQFNYVVQPRVRDVVAARQQIAEWREWSWQTWGPGQELAWSITATPDAHWAWDTEYGHLRIYLKSDAELVMFELKF